MAGWDHVEVAGPCGDLHGRPVPGLVDRAVWLLRATRPAVVLGSAQPGEHVDERAARSLGADVVRRRSGGGAVWVGVGDPVWVDVLIGRDDPLWVDDVGESFAWLGRCWARALGSLGVADPRVHEGPMRTSDLSSAVCFAGVGPGEVLVGQSKVVGISQRRTRAGARFQCAVPVRWDPGPLAAALVPEAATATVLADLGAGLADLGVDLGRDPAATVVGALLAALP